jgi:hypothetical protein
MERQFCAILRLSQNDRFASAAAEAHPRRHTFVKNFFEKGVQIA